MFYHSSGFAAFVTIFLMRMKLLVLNLVVILAVVSAAQLTPPAFKTLPVGSVTPKGWLLKQLQLQAGEFARSHSNPVHLFPRTQRVSVDIFQCFGTMS